MLYHFLFSQNDKLLKSLNRDVEFINNCHFLQSSSPTPALVVLCTFLLITGVWRSPFLPFLSLLRPHFVADNILQSFITFMFDKYTISSPCRTGEEWLVGLVRDVGVD